MAKPARKRKEDAPMPIGNIRAEPVPATVDNPYFSRDHKASDSNSVKVSVHVNVRESAITMLATKGAITAPQAAAAVRFRQLWERMGGSGAGAMDYSRVVVDGGKTPDPISASQMEAGKELKRAALVLSKAHGEYAYKLVGYVCGEGRSIHELTDTRRQRDTMTDLLRMYLDVLAGLWDFAGKVKKC